MLKIYRIHALTNGDAAMKASRLTIDDALKEAKFLLGGEASMVWIDDKDGNPILPADQTSPTSRIRLLKTRFCGFSWRLSI